MKATAVKFSFPLPPFFSERPLIPAVVQNLKHCPVRGDELADCGNSPGKILWGLRKLEVLWPLLLKCEYIWLLVKRIRRILETMPQSNEDDETEARSDFPKIIQLE
ncbi:uncharacterized protein RBU33_010819 isoform 2-T2 [Hipposideros larvatus]